MTTPSAELADLLLELFTTAELRQLLARLPGGRRALHAVPDQAAPAHFAFELVGALERRGLVKAELFKLIHAERPDQADQIDRVARLCVGADWAPAPPTASRSRPPLRILHLSDLHFRTSTQWDAEPLLTGLADTVAGLHARGLAPHAAVLTGDVAFSAHEDEYVLAHRWLTEMLLPAAGLGPDALFVVPGNHDIARAACRPVTVQSTEAALRAGPARVVAEVLADPAQWAVLAPRYAPYRQLLADLGVRHPHEPRWSHLCDLAGRRVLLVGLDTAWLASDNGMKGKLVLGLPQVNALTAQVRDADLVLGLAHHPLDWLTEWDQDEVEPPLQARLDLFLRGHLHKARPVFKHGAVHSVLELPAGSAYAGSKWANTFQLVELDQPQVRVHVFAWVAEHDGWVADRTRFQPDGIARFALDGSPTPQAGGGFTNHFHGDTGPVVQVSGGRHSFHFGDSKKGG